MKPLLKTILIIMNLLTGAVLLFSAYGGHIDPETWVIPAFAFMTFPAILAWAILLLLIDIVSMKKAAFIQSVAILLSAPAIWDWCPMNLNTGNTEEAGLKVMTYNVFGFKHPEDLDVAEGTTMKTIAENPADILLLQEAYPAYLEQFINSDTTLRLYNRYPHRVISPGASLMIWSRFPIDTIPLVQPEDPSGAFLAAHIYTGSDTLTVVNIHLQSIYLNQDDRSLYGDLTKGRDITKQDLKTVKHTILAKLKTAFINRAEQARLLRSQLDTLATNGKIIVGGDFNDIEGCWAIRCIEGKDLNSTFVDVGRGPTVTYWDSKMYFNIDHLLYGTALQPLSVQTIYTKSSDHYPIIATYRLE